MRGRRRRCFGDADVEHVPFSPGPGTVGRFSPLSPEWASRGGVLLSHGLGLARQWSPPAPRAQHSSQRWPVARAAVSGVLLPQGDVLLGCDGMQTVSASCTRKDLEVWAGLAAGHRASRAGGQHHWGLTPPERCGRAPGCSLTKLADVPVSGLAALVIPVEGGRRLHLHTVPEPVPRWEGGKAGQCCGMAVTPHRGRMSVSSRHLPLVVWLPESEAGEGGWLAHIPAEGSLGCLVGETWGGCDVGCHSCPQPGQPVPCLPLSLTNPEVPGLEIGVCYPVTSLQAAEVERQDVLDLLVSDLGQHRPFLLQGRE